MEGQVQKNKDLQVTEELGLLKGNIEAIIDKVNTLEGRLKKVMVIVPTGESKDEKDDKKESALCAVAQEIHDAGCGARKVYRVLSYILDNLQL